MSVSISCVSKVEHYKATVSYMYNYSKPRAMERKKNRDRQICICICILVYLRFKNITCHVDRMDICIT